MSKFSKKEAIQFGWGTAIKNLRFFILLVVVYIGVQIVFSVLNSIFKNASFVLFIVKLISWFVGVVVSIGLIKIALSFVSGTKAKIEDLFSGYKNYGLVFNYFLGSLITGIIIIGGLILLILPGIYFAVKLQFVTYFIVDKKQDFVTAIKSSWNVTRGEFWNLFLLGFLLFGIFMLGVVALVLGLFIAIPTMLLVHAYVYRKLSK